MISLSDSMYLVLFFQRRKALRLPEYVGRLEV
jgi:hypothetical protein